MSFNPDAGNLSGMTDVSLSNPSDDQVLTYDNTASKWQNKAGLVLGASSSTAKPGDWLPEVSDLPAGAVIATMSTTRPTERTDITVMFKGDDPGENALAGDVWVPALTPPPGATPEFVASSHNSTGGASTLTVTVPGTIVDGDVALLFLDTMHNDIATPTVPGWSLVGRAIGAQQVTSDLFIKELTAAHIGNHVATLARNDVRYQGHIVIYRDVVNDPDNAQYIITGGATTVTTPTIASAPAGAMVIEHVVERANPVGTGWTPPGTVTERLDTEHPIAGVSVRSATGDYTMASAGNAGGHTWTSTISSNHQAAWTVVLAAV